MYMFLAVSMHLLPTNPHALISKDTCMHVDTFQNPAAIYFTQHTWITFGHSKVVLAPYICRLKFLKVHACASRLLRYVPSLHLN